jgi:hypothetical protein
MSEMAPDFTEQDERNAKVRNLEADTMLKFEQRRWEPWKVVTTAFAAGVAFTGALLALFKALGL